jgi:hypothetical protein
MDPNAQVEHGKSAAPRAAVDPHAVDGHHVDSAKHSRREGAAHARRRERARPPHAGDLSDRDAGTRGDLTERDAGIALVFRATRP